MENERSLTSALVRRRAALVLVVALALVVAAGFGKKKSGIQKSSPPEAQKREEQTKPAKTPKKSAPAKSTPAKPTPAKPTPAKPAEQKREKSFIESVFTPKTPLEELESEFKAAQKALQRERYKDAMTTASKIVSTIKEREYALRGDGKGGTSAEFAALEAQARQLATTSGASLSAQRVDAAKTLVFVY